MSDQFKKYNTVKIYQDENKFDTVFSSLKRTKGSLVGRSPQLERCVGNQVLPKTTIK